ncbi:MoaD/ThiS family protein [Burkholderia vietnamiensis]|uniref:MoaD/ThiS family protein n=1 Tax=Burkholderia vietnamiensis TaxID=60552 RepID=UPI000D783586|nr:MoaD/ThiS family protein [Burkholderia vietnamiensis]GBH28338.1 molybdopterin synthase sulfur carrier subunit [Burkholderia vietnamiensis]
MKIQLKFFASVREALGVSDEQADVADGVTTGGDVRAWRRLRGGAWAETLAEGRALRMGCNHEMTDPATRLTDGCEVAFFPAGTGG